MSTAPLLRGVVAALPIAVSVVPFGMAAAVSAHQAGLSVIGTLGMSSVIFAGAAQLTALELSRMNAPTVVIIGAAIIVNLRFALYSAALARRIPDQPVPIRAAMASVLTDQAYALSAADDDPGPGHSVRFYFGAACTFWIAWQLGTLLGIFVGASVPADLHLGFSAALAFVALAVPAVRTRPALAAAVTSVTVYFLASSLPYGMGILPAAISGVIAGGLVEGTA